jgi:hypothetical protein
MAYWFIMDRDDDAEREMRCLVCNKEIEKGTPHYRIVEDRIHIECMPSFWRQSSKQ